MRGGQNRLPGAVRRLRGTDKPSRVHEEPVAAPLKCRAPRWLSADAKRAWRYLVNRWPVGVLGDVDLPALALLCTHLAVAMEAAKVVATEGILIDDPDHGGAKRKHPALQVLRDNSMAFRGYAAVFGLTPADRARLSVPEPEVEDLETALRRLTEGAMYADLEAPPSSRGLPQEVDDDVEG